LTKGARLGNTELSMLLDGVDPKKINTDVAKEIIKKRNEDITEELVFKLLNDEEGMGSISNRTSITTRNAIWSEVIYQGAITGKVKERMSIDPYLNADNLRRLLRAFPEDGQMLVDLVNNVRQPASMNILMNFFLNNDFTTQQKITALTMMLKGNGRTGAEAIPPLRSTHSMYAPLKKEILRLQTGTNPRTH
jgi:hypothetical protein